MFCEERANIARNVELSVELQEAFRGAWCNIGEARGALIWDCKLWREVIYSYEKGIPE